MWLSGRRKLRWPPPRVPPPKFAVTTTQSRTGRHDGNCNNKFENNVRRGIPRDGNSASGNRSSFCEMVRLSTAQPSAMGREFVLRNAALTANVTRIGMVGVRFAKWCLSATLIRDVIEVRFAKWCIRVTPIRYGNPQGCDRTTRDETPSASSHRPTPHSGRACAAPGQLKPHPTHRSAVASARDASKLDDRVGRHAGDVAANRLRARELSFQPHDRGAPHRIGADRHRKAMPPRLRAERALPCLALRRARARCSVPGAPASPPPSSRRPQRRLGEGGPIACRHLAQCSEQNKNMQAQNRESSAVQSLSLSGNGRRERTTGRR